jgi:hypothetical protein
LQREAIGDVASGDRDAHTESRELALEFESAWGVRPASAGEDEVFGAAVREPARDVSADGTRAARDEDGAARSERAGRESIAERRANESSDVDSVRTNGELIFSCALRESVEEANHGSRVEGGTQVDKSTPSLGVLVSEDASESPRHGLSGMSEEIGTPDGDGAAGEQPERCIDGGIVEGLCERE